MKKIVAMDKAQETYRCRDIYLHTQKSHKSTKVKTVIYSQRSMWELKVMPNHY